jgi:hypothetical protein
MSRSTQKIELYLGKNHLGYLKIKKTVKKRIFEKRFLGVFWTWGGQITSDKDETYSYCTLTTPLQNELLADPLGFEIKKCEHKL